MALEGTWKDPRMRWALRSGDGCKNNETALRSRLGQMGWTLSWTAENGNFEIQNLFIWTKRIFYLPAASCYSTLITRQHANSRCDKHGHISWCFWRQFVNALILFWRADFDKQREALYTSATTAYLNRKKTGLGGETLGVNALFQQPSVYEHDVRGKKDREPMFLF